MFMGFRTGREFRDTDVCPPNTEIIMSIDRSYEKQCNIVVKKDQRLNESDRLALNLVSVAY